MTENGVAYVWLRDESECGCGCGEKDCDCAGSGTTAVAALNTGRRYICFENAPAIFAPALERVALAREAVAAGGKGE